jgi:site-specific DNA recombinase
VKKVFLYARVSSKEQEKEGFSVPAQLKLLTEYAEKNGFTTEGEYTDVETAKKAGRGQFKEMVEAIKKNKDIKAVLVEKTDRLTRNFYDMVKIDDMIWQYGVEFHLIQSARILGPSMNRADKTQWRLEVLMATDFIDGLRENTQKGIVEKLQSGGWCGRAPYGYKMVDGKLYIDDERAPFVRRAFELYATGFYSLQALRKVLIDEGYTYQPATPRVPTTQLHNILHNPLYIAENYYRGEVIDMNHEPLISRELWYEVQRVAGRGKVVQMQKREFLYRDLLTCGVCGSVMSGEIKGNGKYTYYRCWKAANGECDSRYVNENLVNKAVSAKIERLSFPAEYKEFVLKSIESVEQAKENTARDEHARLDKEIDRLKKAFKKAYMDRAAGTLADEMYEEIKADIEQQLAAKNEAKYKNRPRRGPTL